jgi:hypothetical protein
MDAWPARWRLLPGFSQFHDLLATDRATFMIGEILSPRAAAFERIKRLVLATLPSAEIYNQPALIGHSQARDGSSRQRTHAAQHGHGYFASEGR